MTLLLQSIRRAKRTVQVLRGKDLWQQAQIACDTCSLGNEGARWCICAQGLGASSAVYSIGVGEEISFDLEVIHRFGVCVHAFDPTPRSIEWLAKQSLPGNFVFHPCGVADFDGYAKFLPPANPAHVSHTLVERQTPWPAIEVPVRRLRSIMHDLGHKRIDLLKMDIEGAEYAVLKDLLASRIAVNQLLVEFHHRWQEIGVEKTRQAIRDLNFAGYRIFDVSPNGEEYGFLRIAEG
ncbi:MAG TPA: FkbM family methyltransferase [Candidatus Acidoferrum sp.]|nr:FkbM family methyltransferase [Candidatus Acidoferrum sp.]